MQYRKQYFDGLPGHTKIHTKFLDVETIASILFNQCAFLDHPLCSECSHETHLISRSLRADEVGQFERRVYLCNECGNIHETKIR